MLGKKMNAQKEWTGSETPTTLMGMGRQRKKGHGNENGDGGRGEIKLWNPPDRERGRVEDQVNSSRSSSVDRRWHL